MHGVSEAEVNPMLDERFEPFVAQVKKPAPFFKGTAVVDKQFKDITLKDFSGKWLVLFFYPLDFTFVCPTEICEFSDRSRDFRSVNCEVVACSVDSKYSHLAWINTPRNQGGLGDMKIPVLSDVTRQISRDYGVLVEEDGFTLRGTFVIDPNGIVRHLSVNDRGVGRSVDEVLRLVRAFQEAEKTGDVCPSGWTPGKPTMKADPTKSKEYFSKISR
jgi:alkyl hydroperoxide reductase subunit AhpC